MYKFICNLLLSITILLPISSCVVNTKNHGYDGNIANINNLKVNSSTKEDVMELLGSPSTISSLNDNEWYYISLKTQKISIFNSNVTEHKVIKLIFKEDILKNISITDSKKKKKLEFNKSESSVKGNNTNPLKDFVCNIGRYNKTVKR